MATETNVNVNTVTLDDLRKVFHHPREAAAESLGLTVNELKKVLKLLGITRWPYRKLASLQCLHQDLEQQLQQFTSMEQQDPTLANHVKDLQEMQARIAEDSAKIMQDPNHPLDEGLHKLRLQNYKARFMGKHGLITTPPILKLPPTNPDAAALDEPAPAEAEPQKSEPQEGEVGWTGRRRRAASIAASNSIKRAAGLVSADSDEEEAPPPSLSRSKTTGRMGGSSSSSTLTNTSRPPLAASAGRGLSARGPYMGPATLAALPCLPEYGAFHEEAAAQARMAQSAPLYDESRGGMVAGGMSPAHPSLTSLNQGVAGMSLEQQRYAHAMSPHMPVPSTSQPHSSTSSLHYQARAHPVPSHLLPQPGAHSAPAWPHFSSVPALNQHHPPISGGYHHHQPVSAQSDRNSASNVMAGAPGMPYHHHQHHMQAKSEAWATGGPHAGHPHGYMSAHHAAMQRPRHMQVVEPLVTPLEALLDDMVSGGGAGGGAAPQAGMHSQAFGAHTFPVSQSHAGPQSAQMMQTSAGGVSSSLAAGVAAVASGPGTDRSFEEAMRQRRVPQSSMFLLNSDDEDDVLMTALLTSPANDPRSTRYLGGSAHHVTHAVMDSRATQQQQQHVSAAAHPAAPPSAAHSQQAFPHHQPMQGGMSAPLMMSYGQRHDGELPSGPVVTTGTQGTTISIPGHPGPSLHTISSSPRPRADQPLPIPFLRQGQQPQQHHKPGHDGLLPGHHMPAAHMQGGGGGGQSAGISGGGGGGGSSGGYHQPLSNPYPYMPPLPGQQQYQQQHQQQYQHQQHPHQQQHQPHHQQHQQQLDLSDMLAGQGYDGGMDGAHTGAGAMDVDLLELDRIWRSN